MDEVLDESGEYHEQALEDIVGEIAKKAASFRAVLAEKHADKFPEVWERLADKKESNEECDIEVEVDEACLWAHTLWTDATYVKRTLQRELSAETIQVHLSGGKSACLWLSQERPRIFLSRPQGQPE